MKRFTAILLSIFTLFALTACQPTPEAAVVVQKDTDRMVEQAANMENGQTLSDLSIPEGRYVLDNETAGGRLKIHVDTKVRKPDVGSIPIRKAAITVFTQEQVTGIFNYLFPDEKPINQSYIRETRADIEKQIVLLRQRLEDKSYLNNGQTEDEMLALIAAAEERYKTAPETLPAPAASDGTMTLYEGQATDENGISIAGETSRFYLLSASFEGYTRGISVSTALSASLRNLESANHKSGVLSYWDNSTPTYTTKGMLRTDGSSLPEAAQGKLTISYDEAKALCDGFFAAAGMDGDFGVGAAFIVDDKGTGLVDGRWENGKYIEGLKNPAQNYAWQFYYARMADNIPIMLNTIAGGSTGSEFQISWNYEYICFTVDNNGIASVHWMSPLAVGDVVQENAVLKSFPEIMGVFEKMVRVQYEPMLNTRYPDGNIEINVDDIELCLMRVREPNGDGTTGLLVPAWVFYGHNIATHSTGEQSFDFSGGIAYRWPQAPIVLFAINAIDGSVINFTWGY